MECLNCGKELALGDNHENGLCSKCCNTIMPIKPKGNILPLKSYQDDVRQVEVVNGVEFSREQVMIVEALKYNFEFQIKDLKKKLAEQPKQIIEKVKSYFTFPDGYESFVNYCEDDVTISESDFMEFLDKILKEYKGDKNG